MELKTVLFEKAAAALENYKRCKREEPKADWELDRRTFCALWDVIEAARLVEEYEAWKYN